MNTSHVESSEEQFMAVLLNFKWKRKKESFNYFTFWQNLNIVTIILCKTHHDVAIFMLFAVVVIAFCYSIVTLTDPNL